MEQLNYFQSALKTEIIKMKNTLGIWTALIFPLFVVFMNFMIYFNRPKMLIGADVNPWIFMTRNAVTVYSVLFLPLFIAVITFYINFNEHKSNAWRQIYALPVPKGSVYLAKFFVSAAIISASMLFFYIINYLSMILLIPLQPDIPFAKYSFDSIIAATFIKITIASMGIAAIQFLISILSGNFIYPLGFGLLATFAGVFLVQWEKIIYYPYSFPFQASLDLAKNNYSIINQNTVLSIITAVVFVATGYMIHFRLRIK
jgi:lantibiotic transport system permease protein